MKDDKSRDKLFKIFKKKNKQLDYMVVSDRFLSQHFPNLHERLKVYRDAAHRLHEKGGLGGEEAEIFQQIYSKFKTYVDFFEQMRTTRDFNECCPYFIKRYLWVMKQLLDQPLKQAGSLESIVDEVEGITETISQVNTKFDAYFLKATNQNPSKPYSWCDQLYQLWGSHLFQYDGVYLPKTAENAKERIVEMEDFIQRATYEMEGTPAAGENEKLKQQIKKAGVAIQEYQATLDRIQRSSLKEMVAELMAELDQETKTMRGGRTRHRKRYKVTNYLFRSSKKRKVGGRDANFVFNVANYAQKA